MQLSYSWLNSFFREKSVEYDSAIHLFTKIEKLAKKRPDRWPGLHDIRLLFMLDRFPESGTKNAPEYECLHDALKTAQWQYFVPKYIHYVYYICCLLCLFAKQSINLICIEAILLSKRGLRAFRIGLRCLHVKQNGTDCSGSIFVPPADAEQSYTGLL